MLFRIVDRTFRFIAWKLPKRLVAWCYFRVAAYATSGDYSSTIVPDLSMMDAIHRWETYTSTK